MNSQLIRFLLSILLIAFIIRVIFCLAIPIPVTHDSGGYNKLAQNLISGYGLSFDMVNPTLFRGPGYPLFLAGIYSVVGYNPMAARIIQSLLGALMCLLFYYLSRHYLNESLSRQASVAVVFYPVLVALSSSLLSELLFTFLLGLSAIALTGAFLKKHTPDYFISGLLFGITTLTRPITAYFAPFLLCAQLVFYKNKKLILKHISIFLCGQLLVILPWTIRNYAVSRQFCLVTTGGGIALWLGTYAPGKGYDLDTYPEVYKKYEEIIGKGQDNTALENDRKLFKASLRNIKDDPAGYILLIPQKFLRLFISTYSSFFNIHQMPLSSYFDKPYLILQNPLAPLWKILMLVLSAIILIFGCIGILHIKEAAERFIPLLVIIIFFIAFHVFTFASARSGIPILPFLLIFAVIGRNSVFSRHGKI